jgi:hypothetical protein
MIIIYLDGFQRLLLKISGTVHHNVIYFCHGHNVVRKILIKKGIGQQKQASVLSKF